MEGQIFYHHSFESGKLVFHNVHKNKEQVALIPGSIDLIDLGMAPPEASGIPKKSLHVIRSDTVATAT